MASHARTRGIFNQRSILWVSSILIEPIEFAITPFLNRGQTMKKDLAAAIAIGSVLLFTLLIGSPATISTLLP